MKTIHKAITVITLVAVLICMAASIKAKAETIEASEIIDASVPGADLTSIAYAYNNLSTQQKLIADYLMGAYNYSYLCARGFSVSISTTESNMKAELGAIGERVFQYLTTAYAWRSRFNEVFRQYASSIIVYASKISGTFDNWITEILNGTRIVYIEYSENAFDAWTEFYNDPSGDGIAHFGDTISSWHSGNLYDFAYTGYPWMSDSDRDSYNRFILNNSPVLYTDKETSSVSVIDTEQIVFGSFRRLPDSLFLLRGDYNKFRFGFSDMSVMTTADTMSAMRIFLRKDGRVNFGNDISGVYMNWDIITTSGKTSYQQTINYAFDYTPVSHYWDRIYYDFYYPWIYHVYLVDNLTTLANPEELYNTDSLNIVAPAMDNYILTPNNKMLIPVYAPLTDPFADLWDVSVDIDNNSASEDDYSTQIVNNTVINNYTIDASDKINVPVDWFDNELSDQLANDSIPFLSFARDCIDTLGDLQIYFYGAIVFGLGGGVLKKLLL